MRWIFILSAALSGLVACGPASETDERERHPVADALADADRAIAARYATESRAAAERIGRPDSAGRIGRNRSWGALHSVRFQYGAGRAVRFGHASDDGSLAREGRRAIAAGLDTLRDDGMFPLSLPEAMIAQGQRPGPSDAASASAFFLSDICPALLIGGTTDDDVERIHRALARLLHEEPRLARKDAGAPNRLLINALAYAACGRLTDTEEGLRAAERFTDAALALQSANGSFLEGGGSDTSYQAVALVALAELAFLRGDEASSGNLWEAFDSGFRWLADRVGPDGALDSTSNTRTCAGETFLGRPKDVDRVTVFSALALGDLRSDNPAVTPRYVAWLQTRPKPCR